jgi:hypothetical protein
MLSLKPSLLDLPFARRAWAAYRGGRTEKRYRSWIEHYGRETAVRGLAYSQDHLREDVAVRLRHRTPARRSPGQVHTGILCLTRNWGIGLVQEAEELGPVSVFDWEQHGFSESDPELPHRMPELNRRILDFVHETHRSRPLDWLLITASGNVVHRDTLRRIREEWGIPTVNQWLDCKQNFRSGVVSNGQDTGQIDIAPEFDVVWTSSKTMCEPYLCVGARPLYLPEGFSPRLTPRTTGPQRHEVGFMGARYGQRPIYIEALRRAGVEVAVRGPGWGTGELPLSQMGEFFGECKINLGFGGVGYSMALTTLKGRDFEVPGAGGVYLTTYNEDLADFFHIGEEILCYRTPEEMVKITRSLLDDEARRASIAERAYSRAMREHRWSHRYQVVLILLGVLEN